MKHRHEQALALLATTLAESLVQVEGAPPSTEELALLLEGKLTGPRRQQVLSYLCCDPTLYQQWLDLRPQILGKRQLAQCPESK